MNRFIMSALVAGSLAMGASFASPRDSLTAEQKAAWAAKREAMKARHDSLRTANKAEMEARRAAMKAAREAAQAKFKALIDAYKTAVAAAATEEEKAALKEKLKADLAALRAETGTGLGMRGGDRDSTGFGRGHRPHRDRFGFGRGDRDSTRTGLTPEQIAELKARMEELRKKHKPDSAGV
jgi:hypothetical protein